VRTVPSLKGLPNFSHVPAPARAEAQRKIAEHKAAFEKQLSPSQRSEVFAVPRLCVEYQGKLALVDEELVIEAVDWNLLDYPADLTRFQYDDASKTFELDIEGSKVVIHPKDGEQLDLNLLPTQQTDVDLVVWLSKQLRQIDVTHQTMTAWALQAITMLLKRPGLSLPVLVRAKFILARKLAELIEQARKRAYKRGWNQLLFEPDSTKVQVNGEDEFAFRFKPDGYQPDSYYSGPWQFTKHYYPRPGDLKPDGDEFECAVEVDRGKAVKTWVRNIPKRRDSSFWLQTSSDRFYPDFVAQLQDGRVLAVEYKGEHLVEGPDTNEKRKLGELWAARSGGKAVFLMAEKVKDGMSVAEQITAAVALR
jgi:type III restriction enzyme